MVCRFHPDFVPVPNVSWIYIVVSIALADPRVETPGCGVASDHALHSMIFLLSPAKTLKAVQTALVKSTQPNEALTAKAQVLLTELQALSRDQLKSLLKVSDSIAK